MSIGQCVRAREWEVVSVGAREIIRARECWNERVDVRARECGSEDRGWEPEIVWERQKERERVCGSESVWERVCGSESVCGRVGESVYLRVCERETVVASVCGSERKYMSEKVCGS